MKEKVLLGLLKGVAILPLRMLYLFSDFAFIVLFYLIKYRRNVVVQNLKSAFPEKPFHEIKLIEKQYYHYLADQIVETVKIIHISDSELSKRVKVTNYEAVNDSLSKGKNCVLLMAHYGNWEWVQEITRYFIPDSYMTTVYRPLASKLWDDIYLKLRGRWGAHLIPMNNVARVLVNRDNFPWVCGFIADQRTGRKTDGNWVDFLNHKTWFIYGPEEIGKKLGADFFYLEMLRKERGKYEIIFHPLHPSEDSVPFPYTREFWHKLEDTIREYPPFWLWSHKRWK